MRYVTSTCILASKPDVFWDMCKRSIEFFKQFFLVDSSLPMMASSAGSESPSNSPGAESAATPESVPTKETFYSNLNGTSTLEISLIASGAPVCVLLGFSVVSVLVCVLGMRLKPW